MKQRFVSWQHWGISFWTGERNGKCQAVAEIQFPLGACGPCDGFLGSPERKAWNDICVAWVDDGVLPDGAHCPITAAWKYDPSHPKAKWDGNAWVFPALAALVLALLGCGGDSFGSSDPGSGTGGSAAEGGAGGSAGGSAGAAGDSGAGGGAGEAGGSTGGNAGDAGSTGGSAGAAGDSGAGGGAGEAGGSTGGNAGDAGSTGGSAGAAGDAGAGGGAGEAGTGGSGGCTSPSECSDGDLCTQDLCTNHVCANPAIPIDDDNDCTTDSCDPATGVKHEVSEPYPQCGASCPAGWYASSRGCDGACGSCTLENHSTCAPVCGDSFEACGSSGPGLPSACPAGYHAAEAECNSKCGYNCTYQTEWNWSKCVLDTTAFDQCGTTCPTGYHATSTFESGSCSAYGVDAAHCVRN